MDYRYFETLKVIADEGSYQRAAQKLGYAQSTITFQVRQLEQELGVTLFEKIGRRMMLTQAGKGLMPQVDKLLQIIEEIKHHGKTVREMNGELKVAVPESFLCYRMQEVLATFRAKAPDVRLSLRSSNCHDIKDSLLSGESDIGIDYIPVGVPSLVSEELCRFTLSLVASPALEEKDADFMTPGQDKPVSFIINEPHSIYRDRFEDYLRTRNIHLASTIELWSIESIKKSVQSNLGVTFLPRFTVQEELQSGALRELKCAVKERDITAYLLYHKNKWFSPAMELFTTFLRENL